MKKHLLLLVGGVLFATGCGSMGNTVLQDFGIQDRPEGYVSGADQVMKNMQVLGESEMRRLNSQQRRGEVKFENSELDGSGVYFKEVKEYQRFFPLDAQAASRNSQSQGGGYVGYIQYTYEIMQGPRKSNRVEAESAAASIPTGQRGSDSYRYHFGSSGVWDGSRGELTKK